MRQWIIAGLLVTLVALSGCADTKIIAKIAEDGSGELWIGLHYQDGFSEGVSEEEGHQEIFNGLFFDEVDSPFHEPTGIGFRVVVEKADDGKIYGFFVVDIPTFEAWGEIITAYHEVFAHIEQNESTDESVLIPIVMRDSDRFRVEFYYPKPTTTETQTVTYEVIFEDGQAVFQVIFDAEGTRIIATNER